MASKHAKSGHEARNEGIEALKHNHREEAGIFFYNALDHFEAIEEMAERRDELGPFGLFLDRVGYPDMALMAAQAAVELDKKMGNQRQLAEDTNTCGNAHLHLGNNEEALSLYRQALNICLENGDFDNAASASTNIALIIGNRGEMGEAIKMMYKSLEYIEKKPNPSTEIITRIALTQALEVEGREPLEVFSVARPIARFGDRLRPDQWEGLRGPLEQTVTRYNRCHPESSAQSVKQEYLPNIF